MTVFEQVREIVAKQLSVDVDAIHEDTTFFEVDADSLDVVEVIMSVETTFDVELPDEEVENLKNVGALSRFIEAMLK